MSDIYMLSQAIDLNRQELIDKILFILEFEEVDVAVFDEIMTVLNAQDQIRDKYLKALEAQVVIDAVLKDKLI